MHLKAKNIICLGDTHTLDYSGLLQYYNLENFVLIHLGDSGEKDSPYVNHWLTLLNDYCVANNGYILTVRGNHSNPAWFRPGHHTDKYDRVKFIPDYSYITINDKKFLFVGGAISIDRKTPDTIVGVTYWPDEIFVLPDNLKELETCQVLITHSTSMDTPPFGGLGRLKFYTDYDPLLLTELPEERKKIGKLIEQVQPRLHIYGHFHQYHNFKTDTCEHYALDINQLLDITDKINNIN